MSKAKKDATKKETKEKKDAAPSGGTAPRAAGPRSKAGKKGKGAKPAKKAVPSPADLEALRKPIEEAKTALVAAEAEANEATEKARSRVAGAKEAYRQSLTPYREACRRAGIPCEFEGGRGANVSEKVTFEVERVEKGVRVAVKGKAGTTELIPLASLKESINKAAYAYTDKHVGAREVVGNKGGSLSNRLRAALR